MPDPLTKAGQAVRSLIRSPGLSALAVVALALGIGLSATMFSIVYGALYRGLPFEDADRIVHLEKSNPSAGIESMEASIHDFTEWREQQGAFTDLAAFYTGTVNLRGTERAIRFDGGFMSPNAFDLLGVQPALGRSFRPEDGRPQAPLVVLLGDHVWKGRFDADPGVVGRTVTVNGETATVIGVMPEGFRFPVLQDVWVPLRLDPLALERGEGQSLEVFGRLREGVGLERAQVEMNAIARRLAEIHPETNEGVQPVLKPYTDEFVGEEEAGLLWTMMGAVSLVLLMACVNVANLLLARAAARTREVAVRAALGAGRRRILLGRLGESLALAAGGAVLGTGIAWVGIRAFANAVLDTDPPFWLRFELDLPILLFVAGISAAAALLAGVIPALKASGGDVAGILRDESRGSSGLRIGRMSRALVAAEVALSMGLLVSAGLMTKSIVRLGSFEYPFAHENVFTARLGLFEADYPDAGARQRFFDEVLERVEGEPGVRSATLTAVLPGLGSWGDRFAVEGRSYDQPQDHPITRYVIADAGYFRTFEIPALKGRLPGPRDGPDALPVAVVNESFVREHFPGEDPLGKRIRLVSGDNDDAWRTIVGVVPDMHIQGLNNAREESGAGFYVPLRQSDLRFVSLAVKTAGPPLAVTSTVRDAVASVDQDVPLYWVDSLEGRIEAATWFYRIFGGLFFAFGLVALFLASVGLYGVMSFGVSRRTREMGVRMAMGADAGQVLGLVVGQGMRQVGVGLLLGLGLAVLLGRGIELVLFQVDPGDPGVFAGIAVVLLLTGLVACGVPARRATRVDPVEALRYE